MVIIETPIFTRLIKALMSDDDYRSLQEALVQRPDTSAIIQGSGGLRKVRWSLEGTGKSGGVRVIYYWVADDAHIRMLYTYPKDKQEKPDEGAVKKRCGKLSRGGPMDKGHVQ